MISHRDNKENIQEEKTIKDFMSIDKILFACVASYLLGMVLWVSIYEQFWSRKGQSLAETQSSSVDAPFIDYIRRSLLVIDNKQRHSQSLQASQTPQSAQTSPPSSSNSNSLNAARLDNIYVPIPTFQPPSLILPPSPPLASSFVLKPATLPNPMSKPAKPVKAPVSIIPPPPPLPSPPSPLPPPPRERVTTVPTLAQNPIAQLPSPEQVTTNFGYSLVGLMESGDKSMALFNISGITQRINLGEEIGSSGWSLLSVANQQAVLSKGGETRSIYVGNQF